MKAKIEELAQGEVKRERAKQKKWLLKLQANLWKAEALIDTALKGIEEEEKTEARAALKVPADVMKAAKAIDDKKTKNKTTKTTKRSAKR